MIEGESPGDKAVCIDVWLEKLLGTQLALGASFAALVAVGPFFQGFVLARLARAEVFARMRCLRA